MAWLFDSLSGDGVLVRATKVDVINIVKMKTPENKEIYAVQAEVEGKDGIQANMAIKADVELGALLKALVAVVHDPSQEIYTAERIYNLAKKFEQAGGFEL